jgi:hypothetical protein
MSVSIRHAVNFAREVSLLCHADSDSDYVSSHIGPVTQRDFFSGLDISDYSPKHNDFTRSDFGVNRCVWANRHFAVRRDRSAYISSDVYVLMGQYLPINPDSRQKRRCWCRLIRRLH